MLRTFFLNREKLTALCETNPLWIFSSKRGVMALSSAGIRHGQCVAVGPETAKTAQSYGFEIKLISQEATSASLLKEITKHKAFSRHRFVFAAGKRAGKEMIHGLRNAGFRAERVDAYEVIPPVYAQQAILEIFLRKKISHTFVPSPSALKYFLSYITPHLEGSLMPYSSYLAMGPTTSSALKDMGIKVDFELIRGRLESLKEYLLALKHPGGFPGCV